MLSDTEVEQSHGCVRLHQNVGGLQIAMDDGMLVCILHCLAHGTKKLQTFLNRALVLAAILDKWNAFDILHDKPGSSVVKGVRVVEPCYGRMIELCVGSLLAGEAFTASGRQPCIA